MMAKPVCLPVHAKSITEETVPSVLLLVRLTGSEVERKHQTF